jgi:hypothetical protein
MKNKVSEISFHFRKPKTKKLCAEVIRYRYAMLMNAKYALTNLIQTGS